CCSDKASDNRLVSPSVAPAVGQRRNVPAWVWAPFFPRSIQRRLSPDDALKRALSFGAYCITALAIDSALRDRPLEFVLVLPVPGKVGGNLDVELKVADVEADFCPTPGFLEVHIHSLGIPTRVTREG